MNNSFFFLPTPLPQLSVSKKRLPRGHLFVVLSNSSHAGVSWIFLLCTSFHIFHVWRKGEAPGPWEVHQMFLGAAEPHCRHTALFWAAGTGLCVWLTFSHYIGITSIPIWQMKKLWHENLSNFSRWCREQVQKVWCKPRHVGPEAHALNHCPFHQLSLSLSFSLWSRRSWRPTQNSFSRQHNTHSLLSMLTIPSSRPSQCTGGCHPVPTSSVPGGSSQN